MTKVLITGASGFVGGHLVEALIDKGAEVRCLVRKTSNLADIPAQSVELVYGDLRNETDLANAIAGVDVVYHLAAMTSAHRAVDLMEANGRGTERIAAACAAQATPPVLIYLSSIAASGPTALGNLRVESDRPEPVSDYGRSKLAGEEACYQFADRVPITTVRAGIVLGPRNKESLPIVKTIRRFRFHAVPTLRPPALSYVYVTDLVELLMRAADHAPRLTTAANGNESHAQGIYFAAMKEHPDYAEFGKMIRPLVDRPHAPVIYLPGMAAYSVAGINQFVARVRGKFDSFNIDKIREATASSWACDGAAAERDLGLAYPKSLTERLAEMVAWYREASWL